MMKHAIEKADVLIEALGWIRQLRGSTTVIKIGGSILENEECLLRLLTDIVFMETVGMRPVVVHGGGAAVSHAMQMAGIVPRFVQGRRYTDRLTLKIVEAVLAGHVNREIAYLIDFLGGKAKALNFASTCVLQGGKMKLTGENGEELDLGRVGNVTDVDTQTIKELCDNETVPVIPSVCIDKETGEHLNVNADTAAQAVAEALGAEKLIYLSDINGVRTDKDNPDTLIDSLTNEEAQGLIDTGVVHSGMIPKLQACMESVEKGVKKIHIIDGRIRHALLLEIYTTSGVGTEIVKG